MAPSEVPALKFLVTVVHLLVCIHLLTRRFLRAVRIVGILIDDANAFG